jgi:hypothetical protein
MNSKQRERRLVNSFKATMDCYEKDTYLEVSLANYDTMPELYSSGLDLFYPR